MKQHAMREFSGFTAAVTAILFLLIAFPPAVAGKVHAAPVTIDVDLPSPSTHTLPGGTLAVRIFAPATPAGARYADGAPVVIRVAGGTTFGSLDPQLIGAGDMIRIVFIFPGGTDPSAGRSSDGTYDYRGTDCIGALRDVTLYAAGVLTDDSGLTIDDVVPVNVLHDNIGYFGSSNGGNISVVTADVHGSDLDGYLRYIVQWESPVSSQMAVVDLGPFTALCPPPERLNVASENPWYNPAGYTSLNVSVNYGAIARDTTTPVAQVFLDGDGDGLFTTVPDDSLPACRTPDLDGDGVLTTAEDVPLAAFEDGVLSYYSRDATRAMRDSAIFTAWPSTLADVPTTDSWWDLREAVRHYAGAVSAISDLKGMILASTEDHVQIATDKPHIHQAFDGWIGAGGSVKINPSRSYVVAVNSALSGRTDLPDNTENTAPADWSDASSYAYPDNLDGDYAVAAVYEMADIATSLSTPESTATVPLPFHLYANSPNPFNPATTIAYDLSSEGRTRLRIYSSAGRLVRRLIDGTEEAGAHSHVWDGTDDAGRDAASGVYLLRIEAGDYRAERKMVLIR